MLLFLVFFPMAAAFACYAVGRRDKRLRDACVIASCAVAFLAALALLIGIARGRSAAAIQDFSPFGAAREFEVTASLPLCLAGLSFKADGFRALYAVIAGAMWLCTAMLSREYFAHHYRNRNRYYFFYLLTLGATLGVFLSADLFTTFVFFEIMSFTSYPFVAHEETPDALRAAQTYLAVAVIGGMVALTGLFLLQHELGTLVIGDLRAAAEHCPHKGTLWAGAVCALLGFGAKAGLFPLHVWLPKAHPVAPAPASALLSGILTKTGVFGVIAISADLFFGSAAWGNLLLALALVTMLLGAVLAVFSVNLKRTLACSSMSQIGFIVAGVAASCLLGEENALAARGALLYMVNHSLFKLILFMAAGVVYMNLHKLRLDDVRGFGRGKPLLHFAFAMGALGLMGVPLFSGYVSKTLIHEGLVEYAELLAAGGRSALLYRAAEWVYLFSGGLTAAYMLKLYICLFWQKHPTEQARYDAMNGRYMGKLSALALGASALLVPLLGVCPNRTMDAIADFAGGFLRAARPETAVAYFSLSNLKGACISLTIGALTYLLFIRRALMRKEDGAYCDRWPARLDLEERVYRPAIGGLLAAGCRFAALADEENIENRVYWPLLRALVAAGSVVAKALGDAMDALAQLAGVTVFAARRRTAREHVGNPVTEAAGAALDGVAEGLDRTVLRRHPKRHHFTGWLAGLWDGAMEALRGVTHTMSFGLLWMGLGLCVTLVYLVLRALYVL